MEANGPITVGKRTESGAEGDGGVGNRTAMSCEDEGCLEPKAGAEVESKVPPTSVGGIQAPASAADETMEEAGEEAVSVGKAEDAMLKRSLETPEMLASTTGRVAASVMRENFRSCSEFDIASAAVLALAAMGVTCEEMLVLTHPPIEEARRRKEAGTYRH
jgi:hypothetical protein